MQVRQNTNTRVNIKVYMLNVLFICFFVFSLKCDWSLHRYYVLYIANYKNTYSMLGNDEKQQQALEIVIRWAHVYKKYRILDGQMAVTSVSCTTESIFHLSLIVTCIISCFIWSRYCEGLFQGWIEQLKIRGLRTFSLSVLLAEL